MAKRSPNVVWQPPKVGLEQRQSMTGQTGCVVWLTGLCASGKSTLATELEERLLRAGRPAYVLDGDNLRHGLCADLGFSAEDRRENIRRVAEVARMMAESGAVVIAAFVSPFNEDRAAARHRCAPMRFYEIWVSTPIEACEARDPKGLYRRARAGEIPHFTGISSPYEAPLRPDLSLDTTEVDLEGCLAQLLGLVETGRPIEPACWI